VDIVHFHGVDCAEYLPSSAGVPIVVTLHLWPDRYPNARPRFERAQAHLVSVSRAQASACAAAGMRVCRTIPNGVEVQTFRGQPVRESSVLLLGRISPEKGFHLAIDAARRASLSVLLAGAVFPYASHREYFEYVIVPRLAGDVRFIGPVDAHAKRTLLGTVSCVGLPSIVPETSSLTAMEALASGTPVVALRSPALEELIDHGRTGFLVDDVDGMAQAFASIHAIGPDACRQAAEQRCQLTHMTAAYLQLYEELAYEHGSDGLGAGASGTQVAPFARHE
jgi:glycosyltransferase involved in cell wall biosynthesis